MKSVNIIFPHQLFEQHEIHDNGFPIYLVEEYLYFKKLKFHKRKIAYHRATMKCHQAYLEAKGITVHYIASISANSDICILIKQLADSYKKIVFIDPTDDWLEQRLKASIEESKLASLSYENPLFINSRDDLQTFFKASKKSFFHTTFYKQERKKHGILLDSLEQPLGGKWSYDDENRKKYPRGKTPPAINFLEGNDYWKEAVAYTEKYFPDNYGSISEKSLYPISHEETRRWLIEFLKNRFEEFGHYEDAILKEQSHLHHSLLTPMLNIGLISPKYIVNASISFARKHDIPLNSLEGFIRQIIGWREFIRGMYQVKGRYSRTRNFWGFNRKIPSSFYTGSTGIEPIDETIKKILKDGYCHHIERLMLLGNFMLLCEFHPNEVYEWFMEMFIDAYDWVMVPNVYGMSQFADGGLFATKPYISGSNYVLKMSNYKRGDWQKTWDGLFWRFMHVHRDFFSSNHRLGMLVRNLDKMGVEKRSTHISNAEFFLKNLEKK
ncbi:MAG: cryptochrome/photolyase family protein [Chitinophagales bacterium]